MGAGGCVKAQEETPDNFRESSLDLLLSSLSIVMGKRSSLGVLEDPETTEVPGTRIFVFLSYVGLSFC